MHRSGTSALAGLLCTLGGEGPRDAIGPNEGNPRGHFEPRRIVHAHDLILARLGQSWTDWWAIPPGSLAGAEAGRWAERLAALVRDEYGLLAPAVIKDPRACRLVPLWHRVAALLGRELRIVIAWRDPGEVAASLHRRDGMDPAAASLLWLRHVLDAERETRGLPRVVVGYDALLGDWRAAMGRIASGLALPLVTEGAAAEAADGFISPDLRRARPRDAMAAAPWAEAARHALQALEREPSDPAAMATLDRLERGLRGEDEAWGPALLRIGHDAAIATLSATRQARLRTMARLALLRWGASGGAGRQRLVARLITLGQAIPRRT
jgi:hypothetical protein